MPIFEFENIRPVVHPTAFVHPQAVLIGDVIVGPRCFIAPGASLRGDVARITIGAGTNVQDNCIVHSFPGTDVVIEENVHVGHGAIVHGCVVGHDALIGMNAVIMDNAVVGPFSFVGAMSFVKTGMEIPERTLVAGIPARVKRALTNDEIKWKQQGTQVYQHCADRFNATMRETTALPEIETDRPLLPAIDHGIKRDSIDPPQS